MDKTLKQVLMERNGMNEQKVDKIIAKAKSDVTKLIEKGKFLQAEEYCEKKFGLEPDYLDYLIY